MRLSRNRTITAIRAARWMHKRTLGLSRLPAQAGSLVGDQRPVRVFSAFEMDLIEKGP